MIGSVTASLPTKVRPIFPAPARTEQNFSVEKAAAPQPRSEDLNAVRLSNVPLMPDSLESLQLQKEAAERMIESADRRMNAVQSSIEVLKDVAEMLPTKIRETEEALKTATGEEAAFHRENLASLNSTLFNVSKDLSEQTAGWPNYRAERLSEIERYTARLADIDARTTALNST